MYPRTYSVSRRRKLFAIALALPLGVACLVGAWYCGTTLASGIAALLATVFAVSAAGVAWCVASIFRRQLVLTADELRICGVLTNQVVQRSTIKQFRIFSRSGVLELEVAEPAAVDTRKVNVNLEYPIDDAFADWFEGLHNPDVAQLVESIREVESEQRLGSTAQARIAHLNRARKLARNFQLAGIALVLWGLFYPQPYLLVVWLLIILPWLVLYLCWRHPAWFSVGDSGEHNVRGDLTLSLFLPGAALALRAVRDVQLVELSSLLLPSLLGLSLLLACILWIEPEYRKGLFKVVPLALLLTAYPAGSIALLNTALEWRPPTVHALTVIAQGKDDSNRVTVAAWGPRQAENSIEISPPPAATIPVGGTICVYQYPGALGLDWYRVRACRP